MKIKVTFPLFASTIMWLAAIGGLACVDPSTATGIATVYHILGGLTVPAAIIATKIYVNEKD